MSATVHDVWAAALPPGTQLAGGQTGLDREVRWVVAIRSRPPGLVGIVGVAARWGVDPSAVALADALELPLFSLPDDTSLGQTEQLALRLIAERQAEAEHFNQLLQQQLPELLISGHGLPAVIDRLAVLTRRAVALEDAGGLRHLRGSVTLPDRKLVSAAVDLARADVLAWIDDRRPRAADPPSRRFRLELDGIGRVVAPVAADGTGPDFLSVIAPHDGLTRADALSVSHGATVCALVLARDRAVVQAEDRFRRDVVTDLLAGSFATEAALLERAERLGFDLRRPHLPMALRAEPSDGDRRTQADLARALGRELGRRGTAAPIGVVGDAVGLAYPIGDEDERALARSLHELAGGLFGTSVSVGVGHGAPGPAEIARGYREAERALAIAGRLFAPGDLTFFSDLGVHRLLLALDGHPELSAFYAETLAAIDRYDRTNRAELVATLEAFFAADNSLAETAARLHLHRNTVAYRLRRIEQISGHHLDDAETRLALHLGLRVRQALAAEAGGVASLPADHTA